MMSYKDIIERRAKGLVTEDFAIDIVKSIRNHYNSLKNEGSLAEMFRTMGLHMISNDKLLRRR